MKKQSKIENKNYQPILKYSNGLENALVVVSNLIARASTKWTLEETKMFLCAVSQVKKRDEDNWVTLSKKDLAEKLRIDSTNKSKMRAMFRKMVLKSFVDFDGSSKDEWMSGVLLIGMKSSKEHISVQFNPIYLPLLDKLSSHFTEFYLDSVLDFKHLSSYKLYAYLVSWANGVVGKTEKQAIQKCKIHQIFGLKDSDYWRNYGKESAKFDWKMFENKVLNTAIEEINKLKSCDMNILNCNKVKDGKIVLGYEIEYVMTSPNVSKASLLDDKEKNTQENPINETFDEPMFICEDSSNAYMPTIIDELNALDQAKDVEKVKNKKKRKKQHTLTLAEYLENQPFQTEEEKELFDYIVDRYEYDIQSITIGCAKARNIRTLMSFSPKITEYTDNTELRVLLLDYFEQKIDRNPKFTCCEEEFEKLDSVAVLDDDFFRIDIVKQSLANGYTDLYPTCPFQKNRKKLDKDELERLEALPF